MEGEQETWHGTVAGIPDFGLEERREGWRKRKSVGGRSMGEAIKK